MSKFLIPNIQDLPSNTSKIKWLIVCMFCFHSIYAQQESFVFKLDKTFKAASQIEQDVFGYMWFTDTEGIYKYDGYDYKLLEYNEVFGPDFSTNSPSAIKKDNYQNLWLFTTNGELTKLGKDGQYTSYKKKYLKAYQK